jgi:hypothetical protein
VVVERGLLFIALPCAALTSAVEELNDTDKELSEMNFKSHSSNEALIINKIPV